jgi:lycopene cyclase domain-containing protein
MPVTYLDFHLFFVAPPVLVLLFVARTRFEKRRGVEWGGIGLLVVIALVYTVPWDNYLIARGVWEYAPDSVAMTIGLAPIEEYLFVVLQTVVAGLWLYSLPAVAASVSISTRDRASGVVAGLFVGLAGLGLLLGRGTFYLGAILAWAGPVLALQWGFGWPYLWRVRRRLALGAAVPTAYFAVADRIAIEAGIWSLSPAYTTGISVFGLPIEEGAFFFVTNLFVVQGLLLYAWILRR